MVTQHEFKIPSREAQPSNFSKYPSTNQQWDVKSGVDLEKTYQ